MTDTDVADAVVDQVAAVLDVHIGLRCEASAYGRLRRAIHHEAQVFGVEVGDYPALLLRPGSPAVQNLVNRITVQETAFFRHAEQFDVLSREILPTLRPPVTIWSAACSHGQEPYSLAMVLEEAGVDGSVIATDVSTPALRRTSAGLYQQRELSGLSPQRVDRHFTKVGNVWQVDKPVADRVTVFQHNLLDPIPERVRSCQVVFCRNVLIYFTPQHARAFLDRLADALPRGVWLFLSSTETIWQVSDRYEAVNIDQGFVHRSRTHDRPAPRLGAVSAAPPAARRPRAKRSGTATRARTGTPPAGTPPAGTPPAETQPDHVEQAAVAARVGQEALDAGRGDAAVVEFRKWVCLAPDDVLAHLHLGIALEAVGDPASARRAYGTALRVLHAIEPARVESAIEGYAPRELLKFLRAKYEEHTP